MLCVNPDMVVERGDRLVWCAGALAARYRRARRRDDRRRQAARADLRAPRSRGSARSPARPSTAARCSPSATASRPTSAAPSAPASTCSSLPAASTPPIFGERDRPPRRSRRRIPGRTPASAPAPSSRASSGDGALDRSHRRGGRVPPRLATHAASRHARQRLARPGPDPATPLDAGYRRQLTGGVVAIGNFDGVHRGHAALAADRPIADARRAAACRRVVLTFEPHPRTIFRPEAPVFRLTPLAAKARLLSGARSRRPGRHPLRPRLRDASPPMPSSRTILVDRLQASGVVVGHDFHFGKGRGGLARNARRRTAADFGFARHDRRSGGRRRAARRFRPPRSARRSPPATSPRPTTSSATAGSSSARSSAATAAAASSAFRPPISGSPPDCRLRHGIYAVRMRRADGGRPRRRRQLRPPADLRQRRAAPRGLRLRLLRRPLRRGGRSVTFHRLDPARGAIRFGRRIWSTAMRQDAAAARGILAARRRRETRSIRPLRPGLIGRELSAAAVSARRFASDRPDFRPIVANRAGRESAASCREGGIASDRRYGFEERLSARRASPGRHCRLGGARRLLGMTYGTGTSAGQADVQDVTGIGQPRRQEEGADRLHAARRPIVAPPATARPAAARARHDRRVRGRTGRTIRTSAAPHARPPREARAASPTSIPVDPVMPKTAKSRAPIATLTTTTAPARTRLSAGSRTTRSQKTVRRRAQGRRRRRRQRQPDPQVPDRAAGRSIARPIRTLRPSSSQPRRRPGRRKKHWMAVLSRRRRPSNRVASAERTPCSSVRRLAFRRCPP